jgi:hypothetical protein
METKTIEKSIVNKDSWEFVDEYSFVETPEIEERFDMPSGDNEMLRMIKARIERNAELHALWRCSNVIAVNRLGYSDHGQKHMEIVANNAMKLMRLLGEEGVRPSCMRDYCLTYNDAEVILFLAACLHDIGHAIHRDRHAEHSICLATPLGKSSRACTRRSMRRSSRPRYASPHHPPTTADHRGGHTGERCAGYYPGGRGSGRQPEQQDTRCPPKRSNP